MRGNYSTRQGISPCIEMPPLRNGPPSTPTTSYVQSPRERFTRAVEVDSSPETVFRWFCQLKVAPYSYDWIDNAGRRSPRFLTREADRLDRARSSSFSSWSSSSRTAI